MDLIDGVLGLFIFGSIGVAAITTIETANTDGWSATTIVLWGVVGVFAILGFVKKYLS